MNIPIEEMNNVNEWRAGESLRDLASDIGRDPYAEEIFELAEHGNLHALNVLRAALEAEYWAHEHFYPKFNEERARRLIAAANERHQRMMGRWQALFSR